MDPDEILIVVDDLEYLASWNPDIAEGEIRRGTATIRRLLIEGVYGRAWRSVGLSGEPNVAAVDMESLAGAALLPKIKYCLAHGASFRGAEYGPILVSRGGETIDAMRGLSVRKDGYPGERDFSLTEYLRSPSGVVDGVTFSRRDVIKYISNVRGGVHLGGSNRKQEQKLIRRMSKIDKKIRIATTDGLLVEVVAIAEAVSRSKGASRFIETAKSAFGPSQ